MLYIKSVTFIANHEDELGMKVTDLMYSMIQQMRKEMKI